MRNFFKPQYLISFGLVFGFVGWFGWKVYLAKQEDKLLYQEAISKQWTAGATVTDCRTVEHKGRKGAVTSTSQECRVSFITKDGQQRGAYLSPRREHRYGDRITILYHPEKLKDAHGLNFVWEYDG